MLKGARGRRGFTLIETVVTVGIVATLAAVVVPQVVRQFDAGDMTRVQSDLNNIQSAIETFNVNVKLLPGDIDDLVNQIQSGTNADSSINTTTTAPVFTATHTPLWKGPYLDATIIEGGTAETSLTTGLSARIMDTFVCYAIGNREHGVSAGTAGALTGNNEMTCPSTATGQKYLAIQVTGIPCDVTSGSSFMTLNALFDGPNEATAGDAGKLRCQAATSTVAKATNKDVVYYLTVPIG